MLVKWSHGIIASAVLVLTLSMAGCSTQAKRVDCDGTLKPINRPAPAAASSTAPKESRSRKGNASDEK
jgi:hypothetical protein